jgi:AraC-like DNA-binding protein
MKTSESIQDFYKRISLPQDGKTTQNAGIGHFNVFTRDSCSFITPYSRRDFYKISLIIGKGKLHYADKWLQVDRPALLFSNPRVPYSWQAESPDQQGWFCLFTDDFLKAGGGIATLSESPLFKIGANPVFFIDQDQQEEISSIFLKMVKEVHSDYAHKYEMLRNYLYLLIHGAIKIGTVPNFERHPNAPAKITTLFLELLERQFPIDSPEMVLQLRTAADYATNLSIHVNHLNRSVKEVTGKTTTGHIAARVTLEAQALLRHTNWNVAEIGYSLGFEYPTYFTNFFKKNSGMTPQEARAMII